MEFPIVLKDKNELHKFLKTNKNYILDYLHVNKKIMKYKQKLKDKKEKNKLKLESLINENNKLKELVELNQKQHGEHSMYKGEFDEKQKEIILSTYFNKQFEIDGCKKMHCMDIRMTHKIHNYIVGIECKNKKKIIQQDIDKFKNDKLNNKFKGSVFLSTDSPIKGIVNEINHFKFINDELYIYSKDTHLIVILITILIHQINSNLNNDEDCIDNQVYIDIIVNLYKNWCNLKKMCQKLDSDLVNSLERIGIKLVNGHIYLTSKTKCKGNISPY